jgi:xylulokinase
MAAVWVLGVDLGTTALKAVVSDGTRILAEAEAPVATARPKPLWSEQHPDDWWTALAKACRTLKRKNPAAFAKIAAIGLSGHMHGAVLLAGGKPLRPCILHNDGRAAREAADLNQLLPQAASLAGVRAMAGFTAPKLLWLRRHEPDVLAKAEVVISPKDYLRFRLTGEIATDPVDASGMWLLDVAARRFAPAIVEAVGLTLAQLPELREATALAGQVTASAARALGLKSGLPVVTGTGDAAANTLGLGLVEEGEGVVSLGTAAQIFVTKRAHVPAPALNIHAFAQGLPGRWFQMAAMLNGASPLAWIAARLEASDSIPALLRAVEKRMAEPSRLLFLPFLTGERTPYDDPAMRAAFAGLDATTDEIDLVRAVLEGVALSLKDSYEALTASGTTPHVLYAAGGGFRSPLWASMIASALGRPLHLIADAKAGGALGVARLAHMAVPGEKEQVIFRKPKSRLVNPRDPWQAQFEARLPQYRALYQGLRQI